MSIRCSWEISIPYSTIKRQSVRIVLYFVASFQFLIVQLKVSLAPRPALARTLFQFLIVQLKVSERSLLSGAITYFNSL